MTDLNSQQAQHFSKLGTLILVKMGALFLAPRRFPPPWSVDHSPVAFRGVILEATLGIVLRRSADDKVG
jgi:hypothetical protein